MKRLFLITLLMSSFFLFYLNDVSASEITVDISFDLIDDTFLEIKNAADELLLNNTDGFENYIIAYKSGYYVYYFKESPSSVSCSEYNNNLSCSVYKTAYKHFYSSGKLSYTSSSSNFSGYDYSYNINNILYSTFEFLQNGGYATDIVNLNYSGNTKIILYEEKIPLVYDLYLEINNSTGDDNPPAELENVTNFYTIVIEKISYLAEQFSCNYVLLSIIGIFIVTFIFLLIFRRFL